MRLYRVPNAAVASAGKAGSGWLIAAAVVVMAGCSNSGTPSAPIVGPNNFATTTPVVTPKPVVTATATATATPIAPTPTPTPATVLPSSCSQVVGAISFGLPAGAAESLTSTTGNITETVAAGQIPTASTLCLAYVPQTALPAPLARFRANRRTPDFTAGAGNTYVAAFEIAFTGGQPTSGVTMSGPVPASVPVGTQLNVAILSGGTWVDVGTALVGASGFTTTAPTPALPGVNTTATYLVYVPAAGTNNTAINLGFALIADDSSASIANGLQFVQLEDPTGNAYPTPTTTYFPVTGSDLDGQSLTPDAGHGAVVDGGSSVQFFSGIPQHTFNVAMNPIDVSSYGTDGDSIASLPNGDEVVVSPDGGTSLAVVSGILAGSPVISDTVALPANAQRDGLVLSNDGKVMLSRGDNGLDVYNIAPVAAHAGSTGTGTTSFAFTLTTTLPSGAAGNISAPFFEDGRDGMAISPTDSSRALIVGKDASGNPLIQLLTGLTSASPTIQSVSPRIPAVSRRTGSIVRHPEPSAHRIPYALTPTNGSEYAVTITQDGTVGYVSTDAGIITVSGVNTGNLAIVGTPYSPAVTVPGTTTACQLQAAPSIGTLPDGKYLAVVFDCGLPAGATDATQGEGVILTIPIGAGGALGAPVGQLNNVVTPNNDQIIFH